MPRARSSGRRSVSTPVSAPHQGGLAVVDVAGGAERQRRIARSAMARRRRRPACGSRAPGAVDDAGQHRRVAARSARRAARRPGRPGRPRTTAARPAAAPRRRRGRPSRPPGRRAARRAARPALAPPRPARRPPAARGSPAAPLGVAVESERGLERGQRELVEPQGPGQRVAPAALDGLGAATRIPACGPPSSLSPEKLTRSAPAASGLAGRRLAGQRPGAHQRPGAEVVDQRQPVRRGPAAPAPRSDGVSVKPTTR